jgi:Rrf2 family protein
MLKINRKVEYALMVLKFVAERTDGELTSAREICELFGTPFDPTAKVMQQLNLSGILTSVKGVKGGYTLARPLTELSYLELVEIIDGKKPLVDCAEGECALVGTCNVSAPLKRFNNYLTSMLSNLSVEELVMEHDLRSLVQQEHA